ncbi:MAG: 50S ribosomal protein L24 [Christensenellales bacterium]|jgi:large subunit ribosomal protein L24
MANKLHVKKNDTVLVISGESKGAKGKVLHVKPADGRIVVEGVNKAIFHSKARKSGEPGGRIEREAPLYASKVMPVCPSCKQATRVGHKMLDNGKKARVCKKCGAAFEN